MGAAGLALPFYVIYARDVQNIGLGAVGLFLSAQMLGRVSSNILWAHLSDFVGNRRVIQISALVGLMVPLIALLSRSHSKLLFLALFFLIGFFFSGRLIGKTNYLLDIAGSKDRPTYISLTGTLVFPISLFPLLGGLIVQFVSYRVLFLLTTFFILLGLILSVRLREPKDPVR